MNELSLHLKLNDNNKTIRVLGLLHQFLNASECRGMGGPSLRPHEALSRGKKWHLTVNNRIKFSGYGKAPQFKCAIHENDSLWRLRVIIGEKADCYPELVRIYYRGTEFGEDSNSQTLSQLNLRDGIQIIVMKKDMKSERMSLLNGTPSRLVDAAKKALKEIFNEFSTNSDGTMANDDMRRYILACGAGENSASKSRIQQIFTQHGTSRGFNDRLSINGFYSFYRTACIDRPDHVWNDLQVFKYRYDLRKEDEARKEEESLLNAKPTTLPRYILTNNSKYFNILFNECLSSKNKDLRHLSWKLILRLPTNPQRKEEIMQQKEKWDILLPINNLFSLVYG
eukprot:259945_1